MKRFAKLSDQSGFGIVEFILALAIFPIIVAGLVSGYDAVRKSYTIAKELNEMYAVLSACPEIDRALEYDSVSSATNCYPNNTFKAEGGGSRIISYSPNLTVTSTPTLAASDPLRDVPDSKVINITVGYQHSTASPLELRMLITRNGIGQQ
ncbi:MAG TPA: hypothetical protein VF575_04185 [Candidatus Saccharimonadales bacterium]|jgi:hypothetical protein